MKRDFIMVIFFKYLSGLNEFGLFWLKKMMIIGVINNHYICRLKEIEECPIHF